MEIFRINRTVMNLLGYISICLLIRLTGHFKLYISFIGERKSSTQRKLRIDLIQVDSKLYHMERTKPRPGRN